ncbi:hypothetical protein Tco_0079452 [Tanacetum coccineum]
MVLRAVLIKSGLVSLNTAKQVNTAHLKITMNSARPMTNLSKTAYSTVKRPIHKNTSFKNSNFNQMINTIKDKNVNTVMPKAVVNAARPKAVVSAVKGNNVNAVMASDCWGNPQMDLQDQGVIDSGCSRHMTRDMSYLTDYEEINGGYVAFGGNLKGGKIIEKGKARMETVLGKDYILLPLWTADPPFSQSSKSSPDNGSKPLSDDEKKVDEDPRKDSEVNVVGEKTSIELLDDPNMPALEDIVYSDDEDVGTEAGMNNLDAFMPVSPIPTTRVHKDHQIEQIIGDLNSAPETRRMTKNLEEHVKPKKVIQSLQDPSWIEAMQDELLQFKLQKVKTMNGEVQLQALVDGKKIIITKASVRRDLQLNDEEVFLEKQLEGMSNHKRIYVTPSHTKKIFRNIRKVGKGFSRRETPLFPTMMVQAQEEMGEGSTNPNDPHYTPTIIQPSTSQPQKKQKPRKPNRKDTKVPQPSGPTNNVADEAVSEKMDDSLERAATTTTSLDTEQDRGNINKTQSKATLNETSSLGTSSGSGPRRQETMGILLLKLDLSSSGDYKFEKEGQETKKENRSKTHVLKRLYKVGLSARIESSEDEGLGEEDASKQGRIDDIDTNEDIYLVNVHRDKDNV